MPAVLAYDDRQRRQLDPRTPEGIYNLTLAETGNPDLAERALIVAREETKLARLQGATI